MIRTFSMFVIAALLAACGAETPEQSEKTGSLQPEYRQLEGENRYVMVIPEGLEADQWKSVAKDKCGPVEFCQIYGWTDGTEAPQTFPMTDRELETQAFSYGVNRTTGYEQALWSCSRFKRDDPSECL